MWVRAALHGQCSCGQGISNGWSWQIASISARDSGTVSAIEATARAPLVERRPHGERELGAFDRVIGHVRRLGLAIGEPATEQAAHAPVAPALAGHEQVAGAGQAAHRLEIAAQGPDHVLHLAERLAEHRGGRVVHARAVLGLADQLEATHHRPDRHDDQVLERGAGLDPDHVGARAHVVIGRAQQRDQPVRDRRVRMGDDRGGVAPRRQLEGETGAADAADAAVLEAPRAAARPRPARAGSGSRRRPPRGPWSPGGSAAPAPAPRRAARPPRGRLRC